MKKPLLCLFMLAFAFGIRSRGQTAGLSLSAEMKEPSASTITDFLGKDDNAYYVLREKIRGFGIYSKEGLILESYDKNLKLLKVADIEPKVNGDKALLDHIAWLAGNMYAIIAYADNKSDETKLYFQPIDKKTLLLQGSPKLILSMPYKSKNRQAEFNYDVSHDKNVLAIAGDQYDEKDVKETYKVAVFDAAMNKKWEKNITLPYESKLFEKEDVLVDNDGNMYVRGRLYNEVAKEKRKGEANYAYKILAYRDNGSSFKEYDVNLPNYFITDLGFNITDDGKLAIAGFYSGEGTRSIKGVVFTLVDATKGEILKKGNKDFDVKFISLFDKKTVDKKDDELYRYDLDKVIVRTDGGALLLAEQYWINVSTSTYTDASGHMTSRTTYYYHYNDIVAININPDVSVAWATKIPKRQVTTNDGGYYSSFSFAVVNDKINLVYNDNPDNLKITNPAAIAEYSGIKKSAAVQVQVSSDGKWTKDLLFKSKEQGEILRPKICEQSDANEMFLYAEKGKDYVIGRLTF